MGAKFKAFREYDAKVGTTGDWFEDGVVEGGFTVDAENVALPLSVSPSS